MYECITCKVKSCLSNYCTFHISYVTTNTQNNIHEKNILSLLLARPKIFINITLVLSIAMHRGKSPWTPNTSPAMISCDVLTCSIHDMQQRHLLLCSMIIYFPPIYIYMLPNLIGYSNCLIQIVLQLEIICQFSRHYKQWFLIIFDNWMDCFEWDGLHNEKWLRSCEEFDRLSENRLISFDQQAICN